MFPWVGLQCVIVAFPGHYTHLLFDWVHILRGYMQLKV